MRSPRGRSPQTLHVSLLPPRTRECPPAGVGAGGGGRGAARGAGSRPECGRADRPAAVCRQQWGRAFYTPSHVTAGHAPNPARGGCRESESGRGAMGNGVRKWERSTRGEGKESREEGEGDEEEGEEGPSRRRSLDGD